jgi:hypothetical protein
MFKEGRAKCVHDEERSGRRYAVGDGLVQRGRWYLTISELSCEFPQISCTVFCDIITVRLGYHKFCARWVPQMLTDAHGTQRMASALTFLEGCHKVDD